MHAVCPMLDGLTYLPRDHGGSGSWTERDCGINHDGVHPRKWYATAAVRPLHGGFNLQFIFTSPISAANLTVAARPMLIEATPLVIAIKDYYNRNSTQSLSFGPSTFINGLPDLWDNPTVDLDAGAEVHVIHDAPHHPDLRIITTVAEVFYRIVGTRSSTLLSTPPPSGANASASFSTRPRDTLPTGTYVTLRVYLQMNTPWSGALARIADFATPFHVRTEHSLICSREARSMP